MSDIFENLSEEEQQEVKNRQQPLKSRRPMQTGYPRNYAKEPAPPPPPKPAKEEPGFIDKLFNALKWTDSDLAECGKTWNMARIGEQEYSKHMAKHNVPASYKTGQDPRSYAPNQWRGKTLQETRRMLKNGLAQGILEYRILSVSKSNKPMTGHVFRRVPKVDPQTGQIIWFTEMKPVAVITGNGRVIPTYIPGGDLLKTLSDAGILKAGRIFLEANSVGLGLSPAIRNQWGTDLASILGIFPEDNYHDHAKSADPQPNWKYPWETSMVTKDKITGKEKWGEGGKNYFRNSKYGYNYNPGLGTAQKSVNRQLESGRGAFPARGMVGEMINNLINLPNTLQALTDPKHREDAPGEPPGYQLAQWAPDSQLSGEPGPAYFQKFHTQGQDKAKANQKYQPITGLLPYLPLGAVGGTIPRILTAAYFGADMGTAPLTNIGGTSSLDPQTGMAHGATNVGLMLGGGKVLGKAFKQAPQGFRPTLGQATKGTAASVGGMGAGFGTAQTLFGENEFSWGQWLKDVGQATAAVAAFHGAGSVAGRKTNLSRQINKDIKPETWNNIAAEVAKNREAPTDAIVKDLFNNGVVDPASIKSDKPVRQTVESIQTYLNNFNEVPLVEKLANGNVKYRGESLEAFMPPPPPKVEPMASPETTTTDVALRPPPPPGGGAIPGEPIATHPPPPPTRRPPVLELPPPRPPQEKVMPEFKQGGVQGIERGEQPPINEQAITQGLSNTYLKDKTWAEVQQEHLPVIEKNYGGVTEQSIQNFNNTVSHRLDATTGRATESQMLGSNARRAIDEHIAFGDAKNPSTEARIAAATTANRMFNLYFESLPPGMPLAEKVIKASDYSQQAVGLKPQSATVPVSLEKVAKKILNTPAATMLEKMIKFNEQMFGQEQVQPEVKGTTTPQAKPAEPPPEYTTPEVMVTADRIRPQQEPPPPQPMQDLITEAPPQVQRPPMQQAQPAQQAAFDPLIQEVPMASPPQVQRPPMQQAQPAQQVAFDPLIQEVPMASPTMRGRRGRTSQQAEPQAVESQGQPPIPTEQVNPVANLITKANKLYDNTGKEIDKSVIGQRAELMPFLEAKADILGNLPDGYNLVVSTGGRTPEVISVLGPNNTAIGLGGVPVVLTAKPGTKAKTEPPPSEAEPVAPRQTKAETDKAADAQTKKLDELVRKIIKTNDQRRKAAERQAKAATDAAKTLTQRAREKAEELKQKGAKVPEEPTKPKTPDAAKPSPRKKSDKTKETVQPEVEYKYKDEVYYNNEPYTYVAKKDKEYSVIAPTTAFVDGKLSDVKAVKGVKTQTLKKEQEKKEPKAKKKNSPVEKYYKPRFDDIINSFRSQLGDVPNYEQTFAIGDKVKIKGNRRTYKIGNVTKKVDGGNRYILKDIDGNRLAAGYNAHELSRFKAAENVSAKHNPGANKYNEYDVYLGEKKVGTVQHDAKGEWSDSKTGERLGSKFQDAVNKTADKAKKEQIVKDKIDDLIQINSMGATVGWTMFGGAGYVMAPEDWGPWRWFFMLPALIKIGKQVKDNYFINQAFKTLGHGASPTWKNRVDAPTGISQRAWNSQRVVEKSETMLAKNKEAGIDGLTPNDIAALKTIAAEVQTNIQIASDVKKHTQLTQENKYSKLFRHKMHNAEKDAAFRSKKFLDLSKYYSSLSDIEIAAIYAVSRKLQSGIYNIRKKYRDWHAELKEMADNDTAGPTEISDARKILKEGMQKEIDAVSSQGNIKKEIANLIKSEGIAYDVDALLKEYNKYREMVTEGEILSSLSEFVKKTKIEIKDLDKAKAEAKQQVEAANEALNRIKEERKETKKLIKWASRQGYPNERFINELKHQYDILLQQAKDIRTTQLKTAQKVNRYLNGNRDGKDYTAVVQDHVKNTNITPNPYYYGGGGWGWFLRNLQTDKQGNPIPGSFKHHFDTPSELKQYNYLTTETGMIKDSKATWKELGFKPYDGMSSVYSRQGKGGKEYVYVSYIQRAHQDMIRAEQAAQKFTLEQLVALFKKHRANGGVELTTEQKQELINAVKDAQGAELGPGDGLLSSGLDAVMNNLLSGKKVDYNGAINTLNSMRSTFHRPYVNYNYTHKGMPTIGQVKGSYSKPGAAAQVVNNEYAGKTIGQLNEANASAALSDIFNQHVVPNNLFNTNFGMVVETTLNSLVHGNRKSPFIWERTTKRTGTKAVIDIPNLIHKAWVVPAVFKVFLANVPAAYRNEVYGLLALGQNYLALGGSVWHLPKVMGKYVVNTGPTNIGYLATDMVKRTWRSMDTIARRLFTKEGKARQEVWLNEAPKNAFKDKEKQAALEEAWNGGFFDPNSLRIDDATYLKQIGNLPFNISNVLQVSMGLMKATEFDLKVKSWDTGFDLATRVLIPDNYKTRNEYNKARRDFALDVVGATSGFYSKWDYGVTTMKMSNNPAARMLLVMQKPAIMQAWNLLDKLEMVGRDHNAMKAVAMYGVGAITMLMFVGLEKMPGTGTYFEIMNEIDKVIGGDNTPKMFDATYVEQFKNKLVRVMVDDIGVSEKTAREYITLSFKGVYSVLAGTNLSPDLSLPIAGAPFVAQVLQDAKTIKKWAGGDIQPGQLIETMAGPTYKRVASTLRNYGAGQYMLPTPTMGYVATGREFTTADFFRGLIGTDLVTAGARGSYYGGEVFDFSTAKGRFDFLGRAIEEAYDSKTARKVQQLLLDKNKGTKEGDRYIEASAIHRRATQIYANRYYPMVSSAIEKIDKEWQKFEPVVTALKSGDRQAFKDQYETYKMGGEELALRRPEFQTYISAEEVKKIHANVLADVENYFMIWAIREELDREYGGKTPQKPDDMEQEAIKYAVKRFKERVKNYYKDSYK